MTSLFLPCAAGTEELLADEVLRILGPQAGGELLRGGITVDGDFATAMRLNLESRLAQRVLWPLAHGPYQNEHDLYALARTVRWVDWITPAQTLRIDTTAQRSPLQSLNFATLRVKDAVCDVLREATGERPSVAARHPDLPVDEDGRLNDPVLRENFITRVYAHAEWQRLLQQGLTRRALIAYHSRYKYLLMATDPLRYKSLGRMLGNIAQHDLGELAPRYFSDLMSALKKCATRRTHSNVLQHLSGYLKRALSADEKQEMQQLISQYRNGIVPLVVPLTLLKHHFRRHPDHYIERQVYLQPHPEVLSLRNAI